MVLYALFNKDANFNIDSLKPLLTKYAQFLDSPIRVFAEYERWFTYWKQKSNSKFPTTVLETRDVPEVFPAPAPAGKRAFLVLRLRPENGYFVAGKKFNFFNEVFLYFN